MPPPTKRRRTEPAVVEEITFDPAARQEYLTGFHKRKLQRAKHAQEIAEKRAREERIQERRKLREQRKAELERHVQEVNVMLRPPSPDSGSDDDDDAAESNEEWNGLSDPEPEPIDHEAEYIDEEKYTTVTVETMDVSREGLFKPESNGDEERKNKDEEVEEEGSTSAKKKRPWSKDKPKDKSKDKTEKSRKKRRNFRYESKAERKVARTKERNKNHKQARQRRAG
ncbi:hypothetical protein ABEF95_001600 [Exophiala dermatitidis]|uniref:Ribosomal RNA-processing protein 17 n=1 Tax=Exophiala dermatitidis (strain ATCC 34100 / CBS 525.76 / NIH/UT8656) TaxID=858893 RepID=H6BL69_EXODN|nr:uncharacterized protein HMPREF1120_00043 [Exophiala dermatitidis NIH/UT8656]EHY51816.1 hypothetical protein HMPREF1120_00043 [Exophiala dermatitidis NIH/UT8656]